MIDLIIQLQRKFEKPSWLTICQKSSRIIINQRTRIERITDIAGSNDLDEASGSNSPIYYPDDSSNSDDSGEVNGNVVSGFATDAGNFWKFADIAPGDYPMLHVDLAGIVTSVELKYSKKYSAHIKTITLRDTDSNKVDMLLWRENATLPLTEAWHEGQVMVIRSALVTGQQEVRGELRNIRVVGILDEVEASLDNATREIIMALLDASKES